MRVRKRAKPSPAGAFPLPSDPKVKKTKAGRMCPSSTELGILDFGYESKGRVSRAMGDTPPAAEEL